MPGFVVGGDGLRGHVGVEDLQRGGIFPLEWGIFDAISFELAGKALVQASVSLGVEGISGVG